MSPRRPAPAARLSPPPPRAGGWGSRSAYWASPSDRSGTAGPAGIRRGPRLVIGWRAGDRAGWRPGPATARGWAVLRRATVLVRAGGEHRGKAGRGVGDAGVVRVVAAAGEVVQAGDRGAVTAWSAPGAVWWKRRASSGTGSATVTPARPVSVRSGSARSSVFWVVQASRMSAASAGHVRDEPGQELFGEFVFASGLVGADEGEGEGVLGLGGGAFAGDGVFLGFGVSGFMGGGCLGCVAVRSRDVSVCAMVADGCRRWRGRWGSRRRGGPGVPGRVGREAATVVSGVSHCVPRVLGAGRSHGGLRPGSRRPCPAVRPAAGRCRSRH